MGICNCSMFCCTLLYVHSSIAIILMEKRELVALLNLSSWCLVMVEWLFLAVPWGCLRFVIVVLAYHTLLLFLFCTHLAGDGRAACFTSTISFLSFGCWCFVSLPHGVVVWSTVCDYGISGHTHKHFSGFGECNSRLPHSMSMLDWLQYLKQFFINV